MALHLIPIILGVVGAGSLILGRGGPRAVTKPEEMKDVWTPQPNEPMPTFQALPQKEPDKPSLVKVARGVDLIMDVMTTKPYDGTTDVDAYIRRESELLTKALETDLGINWDALENITVSPGTEFNKTVQGQRHLTPGDAYTMRGYFLNTRRDGFFLKAPRESGMYVLSMKQGSL